MKNIIIVSLFVCIVISYGCSDNNVKEIKNKSKDNEIESNARNNEYSMTDTEYNTALIDIEDNNSNMRLMTTTNSDYIIPNSDKVLITEELLDKLKKEEIDLARNEIYARHGYIFKINKYQKYFKSKSWYHENLEFSVKLFNDIENENISIINKYVDSSKKSILEVVNNYGVYDLDGDGKKDTVKLSYKSDSKNYILEVNEKSVTQTGVELKCDLYIYDINKEDKFLELAVIQENNEGNSSADFYFYNGFEIIYIGNIPGDYSTINTNGNNKISTEKKANILFPSFYKISYIINEGNNQENRTLDIIKEDYYLINLIVIMKEDLNLYEAPESNIIKYSVKKGEEVKLYQTDDKAWCSIINNEGNVGWFKVDNGNEINGQLVDNIFDGIK